MAQKGRLLFEENSKKYYEAAEPGLLVQKAGDPSDANAVLNQRISDQILEGLSAIGIHNQYVSRLNMHETLVYEFEKMPVKCRLQLRADEMDAKLLDAELGATYSKPICEMKLCSGDMERSIGIDDLVTLGLISDYELDDYKSLMGRVSDYLSGFYASLGGVLVSFEFALGRQYVDEFHSVLILTDDLAPANSIIWDKAKIGKGSVHALDLEEIGNRLRILS